MGFAEQRFNVNLSILFTELPLLERPAAAAAAGFTAVELWWPWVDSPTPEQSELDALKKAIETLNQPESPLYPLVSAPAGIGIVDKVNAATGLGNARFLMDLYHLSMNGEDLPSVIERYAAKTGHVQIADNPGRGAPGTGSL